MFVTQCYSGVISGCYRTKSSSSPPPMHQGTRPLPWATLESIDHHTRNYCHLVKSIIFFFNILLRFHFLRKLEKKRSCKLQLYFFSPAFTRWFLLKMIWLQSKSECASLHDTSRKITVELLQVIKWRDLYCFSQLLTDLIYTVAGG